MPRILNLQASRTRMLLLYAAPPIAAIGMIWADMARGSGAWVPLIAGPLLLVGLFGVAKALYPARLVADEEGLAYSNLVWRRRLLWDDIEAIGVARNRAYDGWDRPVVRALGGRQPPAVQRVFIGVSYKPGRSPEKDAGKRAYHAGFTGYDLNLPNVFDRPTGEIVADLEARLAASRSG